MTDADLNALFAEKVAGWKRLPENTCPCGENCGSWELPDASIQYLDDFTSSMDAVLPYLEKKEVVEVIYNDNPYTGSKGYSVQVADSFTEDLKEPSGQSGWVKDPSLPRACVLALLRAKGVGV